MRTVRNTKQVRENNKLRIIKELKEKRLLTKWDLSRKLNLSFATVSNICSLLEKEEFVFTEQALESTGGRKPLEISFNPEVRCILALDLSRISSVLVALLDLDYKIMCRKKISLKNIFFLNSLVENIQVSYKELLDEKNISPSKVMGVGAAITGIFDRKRQLVMNSSNELFSNVNLGERLTDLLNLPVIIENDANIAALAQSISSGERGKNLVFLYFTRGIGLGIIIDGRVYGGSNGFAGEISHLKVTDKNIVCGLCGNKGCFEGVASLSSILKLYYKDKYSREEILKNEDTYLESFLGSYKNKEKDVLRVINIAGTVIGNTVAVLTDLFNPQIVAIGGNLTPFYGDLMPLISGQAKERSFAGKNMDVKIMAVADESSFMLKGCGEIVFQQWQVGLGR